MAISYAQNVFFFERTSAVDTCPDCACMSVRFATDDEAAEYLRNKAEFSGVGKDNPAR